MDYIQPYLDYFSANPEWALVIIFLIAMGEALLIIGLFVPSTAVLVGAGVLVGTGHLGFWPVIIATAVGCIVGDQISYWAGRLFGERLKTTVAAAPLSAARRQGRGFRAPAWRQVDCHRPLRAGREVGGAGHRRHVRHEPAVLRVSST